MLAFFIARWLGCGERLNGIIYLSIGFIRKPLRTFRSDALQEALRIDIDLELEIACGLRRARDPVAHVVRKIHVAR